MPDECEPDCNANGAADSCDILSGVEVDVDQNEIPDSCENWSQCVVDPALFDYSPHRPNREAEFMAMELTGQFRAPDDEYDRIDRDCRLARFTVTNDQLTLPASHGRHRINRLDARLQ